MKNPIAYIELTFSDDAKKRFSDLVEKIVPEEMKYSSPVMPHIRGNVTDDLHLTLVFGMDPMVAEDQKLNQEIEKLEINELKLGKLAFHQGYQGLYKILWIEIEDEDGKLEEQSRKFEDYIVLHGAKKREFKPHLTLAYVENEYELPEDDIDLPETVEVEGTRVSVT